MYYGARIQLVREMHRWTQADLVAEIPGLTQPQLSRIEKGRADASDEIIGMIAASVGVPIGFFAQPAPSSVEVLSPQFRSRSRLTTRDRLAALRWADLILEGYRRLEGSAGSDLGGVPRLNGTDARSAARQVRSYLGFDDSSPLPYLLLALERIGVAVVGLPMGLPTMDAFSAWDQRPSIAVLSESPGDRLRFSVAHELGHLVLHGGDDGKGPHLEDEANVFASELLLPSHVARQVISPKATLSTFVMLKGIWGVSIKSLVYRARELEIMTPDRCLSFYKQISSRGWNKSEPGYVETEKPRAFRKLAELSFGPGPNVEALAAFLAWSEALTHRVLEQHAKLEELPFDPGASMSEPSARILNFRR